MKGYSWSREDFLELLYTKYNVMEEIINGCLWDGATNSDFLLSWEEIEQLPELPTQDTKIYEYHQWATPHCTLYSAFGAVSDLFNYEFTQKEIDTMVEESYNRGRIKWEWWFVRSAVDLVADYWNANHSNLGKVVYYCIDMYDTEKVDKILKKNYTICSWYRGNKAYNADRNDGVLNWVSFWASSYGHAVSWIGREWKRYIKDNYKGRKSWKLSTNIYEVEHTPWELIGGNTFYQHWYLYIKVSNEEEIKRLEEMKTKLLTAIQMHSDLRHLTNDTNYQGILHYTNEKHRNKIKDIEAQLAKYR